MEHMDQMNVKTNINENIHSYDHWTVEQLNTVPDPFVPFLFQLKYFISITTDSS